MESEFCTYLADLRLLRKFLYVISLFKYTSQLFFIRVRKATATPTTNISRNLEIKNTHNIFIIINKSK